MFTMPLKAPFLRFVGEKKLYVLETDTEVGEAYTPMREVWAKNHRKQLVHRSKEAV